MQNGLSFRDRCLLAVAGPVWAAEMAAFHARGDGREWELPTVEEAAMLAAQYADALARQAERPAAAKEEAA